ncbi:hypothetical protein [uncultured Pseudodesulfovibrio sp.]|uniref:hypothetical protein n=1 Tax=uncultured Pseudodesulfovibrio sp. TaxID=2035858 RepID=UPI0029C862DE|nr:hypothetical protein [uncultured Pseudodesulfovibrio sp.]
MLGRKVLASVCGDSNLFGKLIDLGLSFCREVGVSNREIVFAELNEEFAVRYFDKARLANLLDTPQVEFRRQVLSIGNTQIAIGEGAGSTSPR